MKKKKNKNQRRGSVLILAITMVVILALIGIGLIRLGQNARLQAVNDVLKVSARAAADAGMERAVREMVNWWTNSERSTSAIGTKLGKMGITHGPVSLTGTYGNASYTYTIKVDGSGVGVADIESEGTASNFTKTVHAKLGLFSLFDSIGVKDSIDIGVGGGLGTLPADGEFTIHTNSISSPPHGGIMLRNGLEIPGNVYIGPTGVTDEVVVEKKDVVITGTTEEAPAFMDFLPQNPPPSVYDYEISLVPDGTGTVTITEDGFIAGDLSLALSAGDPNAIKVEGNNGPLLDEEGNIVVDDEGIVQMAPLNIYIAGDTILASDAELIIADGSVVNFYLGGSLEAKVGSLITYEGLPINPDPVLDEDIIIEAAKSLSLYGTSDCDSIILKNSTNYFGKINAPEAYLEIRNSGDFYGAIMGSKDLKIYNSGDFYFVSELYEYLTIESKFMGIIPGSWWED